LLTTLRDQLNALPGGDPETQRRYRNAIDALNRAIGSNAWLDGSHLRDNGAMIFASVATAARELAQIAIDQAVVANVNPKQIADAQQKMQEGDASIASGDFVSAIQSFQHAWQRASQR
jgi:hypothetical protein